MSKFRKKPVVIEARQWTQGNGFHIVSWINSEGGDAELRLDVDPSGIQIVTLEGTMTADHDDWIIQGVAGEFYACKPAIFELTYEPVDE